MIKELHGEKVLCAVFVVDGRADMLLDANETVTGALSRLARDKRAANEKRRGEARKKHAGTVVDQSTREFKVREHVCAVGVSQKSV